MNKDAPEKGHMDVLPRFHHRVGSAAMFVLAVICACVYPLSTPWILDEPALIATAFRHNAAGLLATHGLHGTQGVYYGPLPTWIYQLYLWFSYDLALLIVVRAAAMLGLIGVSFAVIARCTGRPALGWMLAFLSPYLWLYSRQLWDNSFGMPIAALTLAAYLLYLGNRKWALPLAILGCGMMILTHLMSIPLIAAITFHALAFRREDLWRSRWFVLLPTALVTGVGAAYWPILWNGLKCSPGVQVPSWAALVFTARGGDWFGGMTFSQIVGKDWLDAGSAALRLALSASGIVHVFVAVGAALAFYRIWSVRRTRSLLGPTEHIAFICLLTLVLQFLYFGSRNALAGVHYYNTSWIAYAGLIWIASDTLLRYRSGRYAFALVAAVCASSLIGLAIQTHRTSGTRSLAFGPPLRDQIAVADAVAAMPQGKAVACQVPHLAAIPSRVFTLVSLRDGTTSSAPAVAEDAECLFITYRNSNPANGGIVAVPITLRQPPPDDSR